MQQLGITDTSFLNLENARTPMHIGGLGIYDPATAPGGFVRFKDILANFEERFLRYPQFRTRLVEVLGGVDRPYWVEDQNFDVEYHIRHIALPKPGDWRQLWIQVARLHSRPMDTVHPLWEAYVIEGLDNIEGVPEGAFAIYTKLHHSLVDGVGGNSLLEAIHDFEPTPNREQQGHIRIVSDREPTQLELVSRSVMNRVGGIGQTLQGLADRVSKTAKLGKAIANKELEMPLTSPKTRFNGQVGPHRVADAFSCNLQDIKNIKNALGCTVNDVCLGLVSGTLRQYLEEKNELPEEPLAIVVPMNMRTRMGESEDKNQIGGAFCSLHTDIDDPVERLRAISQSMNQTKETANDNPLLDILGLPGAIPPLLAKPLTKFWRDNGMGRFSPLNPSSVVTNVPGPNFPMYCAGAKMVRYHGLGLLSASVGLFNTIFSSNGMVTFTVLADREMLPDPDNYICCMKDAFFDLHRSALGVAPPSEVAEMAAESASAKPASKRRAASKAKAKVS